MGIFNFGKKSKSDDMAVEIDNTSKDDNWIINKSGISVSVVCNEMFGSFVINLKPGEKKRVTTNLTANVYPEGEYSYDDLKYSIGEKEKWEIRNENGNLILNKK